MILRNPSVGGVRRLAYLLAGTALASAGFTGEASAVCNVNAAGGVGCVGTTTTTNTTNLNGATAASSSRIQEFNNGANITATIIPAGTSVDGFGLNLVLSNAGGNNTIGVTNDGLITTNQSVAALQLNGNGGNVNYFGVGTVSNTTSGVAANATSGVGLLITNTGAGGVNIVAPGGSVIGASGGIDVTTANGGIQIQNLALVQGNNGAGIRAITGGGGITITGNSQITASGPGGFGILARSFGGASTIANNGNITGSVGLSVVSSGGALSITGNGNITGTTSTGFVANSSGGGLTVSNNGNITGAVEGMNVSSGGGGLTVSNNGNITGGLFEGLIASSGGGGLSITGNGNITGTDGIVANSVGGAMTITTGGTVIGNTATGITANSGGGTIAMGLAHNVTGATHGLNLSAAGGFISVNNLATLTGGTNAILSTNTGPFQLSNSGIINGDINITGSNVAGSLFTNSGTWNTGIGNSTYSGRLNNAGTLNAINGVGGQTINILDTYGGGGVIGLDLGDRLVVGSTANVAGGTLNVGFAPNSPLAHSNVVMTSAALGGTTFATTNINIPNIQTATVTYTATDVIVNLSGAQLGNGSNLNQNQRNIATALNNAFNAGANLPAGVGGLFAFTGPALGNALTQVSGEVATGIQPAANLSMSLFLNAMLDPFVAGRNGNSGIGAPMGYAPQTPSRVAVAAHEAFAADMPVKARPAPLFEQRWSVWSAVYGGYNRTDGDPVVGSNDINARAYGIAAGADYRVSRDTVIGVAGAVGQSNWGVRALGKGDSDVAQVGAYGTTRWENMYLSGAVAFAWHRVETHRTVFVAGVDRLDADFDATSFGGRVEGGYRFGGPQYGLTPYAAVQVQSLRTPNYGETASIGSNQFALTFASQTTTDTRSELGFWADKRHLFANGIVTTLRGRVAWVHDFNPGSRINPAFQTLPGASFTIDGAAAPRDAALTSAVAEFKLPTNVTLIGKVDGEFASGSTTVAGTGTIKYAW